MARLWSANQASRYQAFRAVSVQEACNHKLLACGWRIQAIELALEQAGNASPEHTIFLDDSTRNIAAGHQKGLTTVLVRLPVS